MVRRRWILLPLMDGGARSGFYLRAPGTVLDELGGTLAGATLSLVHEEGGLTRPATTGDSGRYIFVGMPTGTYGVS